ncbi:MAG: aminotransferase class I/II-fold pyridoxal phosphate-dependent enzyme [Acidimicrobiales bacterium]
MIPPGPHGGDAARLAAHVGCPVTRILDLSVNLNPAAPDLGVLLSGWADAARRYPDVRIPTRALARAMEVDEARLLLTNGGSEAITLVAGALGGWVREPEFSLYPRGDQKMGGPRWRSDPHSPWGRLAAGDAHAGVWDESFYALATGRWTAGRPDSLVVGSLTKLLGCPGLRLGYVLVPPGSEDLLVRLREAQPEWSVNALACEALPGLLEMVDLFESASRTAQLRAQLATVLAGAGLAPAPSEASWILVPAPGLRDFLASRLIATRDCRSFGLAGWVRIAVPDSRGLDRLSTTLDEWCTDERNTRLSGGRIAVGSPADSSMHVDDSAVAGRS